MTQASGAPRTLFDKLWDAHCVGELADGRMLIHVDRHLVHDLSSPQAFDGLRASGRRVRNPERTFAMADHIVSTETGRGDATVPGGEEMIVALRRNASQFGIRHFDLGDPGQGIVHVVAPEQGLVHPGMTVVCGDSHTCTLGALGAWAWGIGTSEVEHVLATQTLALHMPHAMRIHLNGEIAPGLSAKDLALYLLRRIGVRGAAAGFVEMCGNVVDALSMEARFTLCNMGIEAGARAAVIAPDEITLSYLRQRCQALPQLDQALAQWATWRGDAGARYSEELEIKVLLHSPQFTWGITPAQALAAQERLPLLGEARDAEEAAQWRRSYEYMGLEPGTSLEGQSVDRVFIGSCTNGRLSDLQEAATLIKGYRVASHVHAMVVPGSSAVRREAEALGLDKIFMDAGFEWREPGCSMCVGMNADKVAPGQRCVSTSNRNFEGRQGPGARTHLASPASAAAAAVAGRIIDHRELKAPYAEI
ncbi:3-isopropylmalate dehydratase large subunit [Ottowia thiooxydans]|uniref:3-isopropylmalate dehydratase large subunit n=1 Tax=Ottowia thiooxydans TaxID=219182 RepID=UPI000408FBF1|nr:3-isopropylmalate dehydratase large subunit [Ottowia thiooxydans]